MADRIKDDVDRMLETMFASAPIADDGFSKLVVRRIKRKLLLRRLLLPVAVLIGGLIAFKPVSTLLGVASQLLPQLPEEFVTVAVASLPALQFIVTGALIMLVAVMSLGMLED